MVAIEGCYLLASFGSYEGYEAELTYIRKVYTFIHCVVLLLGEFGGSKARRIAIPRMEGGTYISLRLHIGLTRRMHAHAGQN